MLTSSTVPVSYQRTCWKLARREEGKLVDGREHREAVYMCKLQQGNTVALGGVLLAKSKTTTVFLQDEAFLSLTFPSFLILPFIPALAPIISRIHS